MIYRDKLPAQHLYYDEKSHESKTLYANIDTFFA